MRRVTPFFYIVKALMISLLHLQESYSLSVIMYAIPALSLTNRQVKELNVCLNNIKRRVFGYHKWESVSALLLSLERLNVRYLIMLRKVTFFGRLFHSPNAFIRNLFLSFLFSNHNEEKCLNLFLVVGLLL